MWVACAPTTDELEGELSSNEVLAQQALSSREPLRGIYHWDAPNGPRLIDEVAKWLGREQDLALAFTARDQWSDVTGPTWQLPGWSQWVKAKPGRRLVYSISLLPGPVNGAGPDRVLNTADDVSLQKCSDGLYDAHWKTLANNLVSYGLGATILRLGWEFDGDWFAWGARGKEAQFAGCFRRVVTSMRAAQPDAPFQFDWNPTEDIIWWGEAQRAAAWPGDAYVDYIGVDAYDASWVAGSYPYPASCDASCRSARQATAWTDVSRGVYLLRDMAIAHGKQLSLPEWGVWGRSDGHGGNDNPYYIAKMHEFVGNPDNHVGYQVYFDVNWEDGSHQLSDVSGSGAGSTAQHDYQTPFPLAAAKFRALFGSAPPPPGDAGVPAPLDAGTPAASDGGAATHADAGPAPSLTNPGFESGATGWRTYGTASAVQAGARAGKWSLRIAGAAGGAEQDLMSGLQVGARYRLSAYGRLGTAGEVAAIGMKFLSGTGALLAEHYAMLGTTSYAAKSVDFVVPTGARYALAYAFKATGKRSSTAWFDDYAIARLP